MMIVRWAGYGIPAVITLFIFVCGCGAPAIQSDSAPDDNVTETAPASPQVDTPTVTMEPSSENDVASWKIANNTGEPICLMPHPSMHFGGIQIQLADGRWLWSLQHRPHGDRTGIKEIAPGAYSTFRRPEVSRYRAGEYRAYMGIIDCKRDPYAGPEHYHPDQFVSAKFTIPGLPAAVVKKYVERLSAEDLRPCPGVSQYLFLRLKAHTPGELQWVGQMNALFAGL